MGRPAQRRQGYQPPPPWRRSRPARGLSIVLMLLPLLLLVVTPARAAAGSSSQLLHEEAPNQSTRPLLRREGGLAGPVDGDDQDRDQDQAWDREVGEKLVGLREALARDAQAHGDRGAAEVEAEDQPQQQSQQQQEGVGVDVAFDGHIESMRGPLADAFNAVTLSPDRLFPYCSFYGAVHRTGWTCPLTVLYAQSLIRNPPDCGRIHREYAFPADPEGKRYPEPLVDLSERSTGKPLPFVIDPAVVAAEKMTYAFYHRIVYNMYAYTFHYADVLLNAPDDTTAKTISIPPPLLPAGGWGNQQLYFVKAWDGWTWPIGQSMTRGDTLLLALRGTIWPGSWATSFAYQYASLNETQPHNIPGRVHKGHFSYASQLFAPLVEQLRQHPEVTRLVLTGHSMGGALSTLLGVYFARNHGDRLRQIEVVTIGAPQVGDADFNSYAARHLNMRRLAYLGSAQRTDVPEERGPFTYGIGDAVPLLPLACPNLELPVCWGLPFVQPTAEGIDTFDYDLAPGNVPFYASDMQNSINWRRKEDFIFGSRSNDEISEGIFATHLCSYTCWASSATGDPEHHCFFPEDANSKGLSEGAICDLDLRTNLYQRYPRLRSPPIDSDLVADGYTLTQWPVVPPNQREPMLPGLRAAERAVRGRGKH